MEEELDDTEFGFGSALPPALVCLTPSVSASPRRLSSCFTQPAKPVRPKRQLALVVSLQEATSAKTVDKTGAREAAAWELFTPIQRVLVVAVVAAAAFNSKKNKQIFKLHKSVELRDQVLLNMQQKLENLCQQVNYFQDQPELVAEFNNVSVTKKTNCGCKHVLENTSTKGSNIDEVFKYKTPPVNVVEPDERRMSDLSDWASSVASSVDIQMDNLVLKNKVMSRRLDLGGSLNSIKDCSALVGYRLKLDSLATEDDISTLQKECEKKDVTIKELSAFIQSSDISGSKRIADLEDIIRRKNMIINKLRKDILILEQKVKNLTRLQRPSFSASSSRTKKLPLMTDNMLFDMESTTGPSDSDSSPRKQIKGPNLKNRQISVQVNEEKVSKGDHKSDRLQSSSKLIEQRQRLYRATSPLKERSLNHTPNSVFESKPKHSSSGENRTTRRPPARPTEVTAPKRWM